MSHYWYNLSTGKVEFGLESASVNRAGPFATAEEAARAPQIIAARSKGWDEEEALEESWGAPKKAAPGDESK